MDSRVVLVTGSSSGIGKAIALLFAQNGYKVVVHGSRSQEKVDKVVDECNKLSPNNNKALGLVADFSDPDNADSIVTRTIDHFGGLDVLVNNVGPYFWPASQEKQSLYADYKKTIAIGLDSPVKVTFRAIEHLRKSSNNPNIIFISSIDAVKTAISSTPYCLSKAAITTFAKCLALELAPCIRSNVVCPGPTDTHVYSVGGTELSNSLKSAMVNKTLMKRLAQPEEIAHAVLYLAEDKAAWITGTNFVVDGGFTSKEIFSS